MSETGRPMQAPATNDEGIHSAIQQINRIQRPGWTLRYDRRTDTLYVRAPNHGPCISYWLPSQPEILLRLNVHTGVLEGIDFTEYRHALMKSDPSWGKALRWVRVAMLMERFGLMRRAARKEQAAAERVGDQTQRLCPAG